MSYFIIDNNSGSRHYSIGHYHAFKGGHSLNALLLNKLFTDKSAWSYICMDVFDDYNKKIAKTRYNLPEYKTGFDVVLANQFSC